MNLMLVYGGFAPNCQASYFGPVVIILQSIIPSWIQNAKPYLRENLDLNPNPTGILLSRWSSARRPCTRFSASNHLSSIEAALTIQGGERILQKTFRWHPAIGLQFKPFRQRKPSTASSVQHWNIN